MSIKDVILGLIIILYAKIRRIDEISNSFEIF